MNRRNKPVRFAAMDGYRGLFVVLVVSYHLGATILVGGWVAINHFFVFSGFLITRLLLHEQVRTGWISVLGFYRRRARRVLPAMMILVSAVLVHGLLFEQVAERKQHAGDAFATLAFYLNWRLISRDDAYFDMTGSPSPLRHAWTLSVEEQFYILIPFVVLAVCAISRSRKVRVSVLAAASVTAAIWTAHVGYAGLSSLPRVYYGTDTRVQCLLVGATAAFVLGRGDDGRFPRRLPRGVAEAIGFIGLAVSISAVFLLETTSAWMYNNGGMLLFAVAAAFMGASAADPRDLWLNRVFGWAPLAFLGRISYGIYLYHWPVVLWLPMSGLPRIIAGPIQLALIIALAAVSFRYIEAPILQHGLRAWFRPLLTRRVVAFGSVLGLAGVSAIAWQSGAAGAPTNVPPLVAGAPAYRPLDGAPAKVGVLGDSVAASLMKGWQPKSYTDLQVDDFSQIGCSLITAPTWRDGQTSPEDPQCTKWMGQWPDTVKSRGEQGLLIVGDTHFLTAHKAASGPVRPGEPGMAELITKSLDAVRQKAQSAGVRAISVMNVPCRRIDENKLDPALRFFAAEGSDDQMVRWVNGVIAGWAAQNDAKLLDLHSVLCSNGFQATRNDIPIYHDTLHFDPRAAAMIWTWAAPAVRDNVRAARP
ncbi:acyltransferase [Yimella sp. cx-573]|nr:acyltransferase [Yimella sp. cx-573]